MRGGAAPSPSATSRPAAPFRGMKLRSGSYCPGPVLGSLGRGRAFTENAVGQAGLDDELRARAVSVAALATCPAVLRARIGRCRSPAGSPVVLRVEEGEVGSVGRAIGLDVHRYFCEVAVVEDGDPARPVGSRRRRRRSSCSRRAWRRRTEWRSRRPGRGGRSSGFCGRTSRGSWWSARSIPASARPGRGSGYPAQGPTDF
jgi:hypothetical protein